MFFQTFTKYKNIVKLFELEITILNKRLTKIIIIFIQKTIKLFPIATKIMEEDYNWSNVKKICTWSNFLKLYTIYMG